MDNNNNRPPLNSIIESLLWMPDEAMIKTIAVV
jgi:hypothetical protein